MSDLTEGGWILTSASESNPLYHASWSIWKALLCTVGSEWKMQKTLRKVLLTSQSPSKRLRDPWGFLDYTLRIAALAYSHLFIFQMRKLRSRVGLCVSQVSQLVGKAHGGPTTFYLSPRFSSQFEVLFVAYFNAKQMPRYLILCMRKPPLFWNKYSPSPVTTHKGEWRGPRSMAVNGVFTTLSRWPEVYTMALCALWKPGCVRCGLGYSERSQ